MSRPRPSPPRRRGRRRRITRDTLLFISGLGLLIFEATAYEHPDPGIVVACTTILLSPVVMRYDEWRPRRRDSDEDET